MIHSIFLIINRKCSVEILHFHRTFTSFYCESCFRLYHCGGWVSFWLCNLFFFLPYFKNEIDFYHLRILIFFVDVFIESHIEYCFDFLYNVEYEICFNIFRRLVCNFVFDLIMYRRILWILNKICGARVEFY